MVRYAADGKLVEHLGLPPARSFDLSLDGWSIAYGSEEPDSRRYIYVYDFRRGFARRITSGGREGYPVWSRDGRLVAYTANLGSGAYTLNEIPATGGEPIELMRGARASATDYMPGDRGVAFMTFDRGAPHNAIFYRRTRTVERLGRGAEAQFSPDGKWVAYVKPAAVWVRAAASANQGMQIGAEGTEQPRWSRDGRKLYYLAPDRKLMEVAIDTRNSEISAGPPRVVMQTHVVAPRYADFQFDVMPDGGFIVNSLKPGAPLTLVTRWTRLLQ